MESLSVNQSRWRPTLGVVAISFNEERDLPGFLDNLLPWVDEIVIVDDGSSDETASIARAAGGRVLFVQLPRQDGEYFSHQRNKGIEVASSDWLLHMDIDERVPPDLAHEIMNAIVVDGFDAFRFRRLNYFLHRPMFGGGWQDWNQIHLARRLSLRFSGGYHEQPEVDSPADRIGQLLRPIWHLNDQDYSERMMKSIVYCEEAADGIRKTGRAVRWYDFLTAPATTFARNFIWKHGYRDGTVGLLAALHSASSAFRSRALVWDDQNRVERSTIEDELKDLWKDFLGRIRE